MPRNGTQYIKLNKAMRSKCKHAKNEWGRMCRYWKTECRRRVYVQKDQMKQQDIKPALSKIYKERMIITEK